MENSKNYDFGECDTILEAVNTPRNGKNKGQYPQNSWYFIQENIKKGKALKREHDSPCGESG
jgi:hypothetical protein